MSIHVMSQVWANAECKGTELLVLLALADFSDDHGENIYPSMQTLARKARLSESQARRVVQNLIKLEYLEIVEEGGWQHGRNRSNSYRIRLETLLAERGSNLTPPPSRPRAHSGSISAPNVVASTRGDPSYDPLADSPSEKMRPTRAQKPARNFSPPADIDPLRH